MAACDTMVLVLSATHGGTALGQAMGWRLRESFQRVVISTPGTTGPSCRPKVKSDLSCTVRFLVGPPIVPDTSASLVLVGIDGSAVNHTLTMTTMIADGYEHALDANSNIGSWEQDFLHKGDMASDPRSGS